MSRHWEAGAECQVGSQSRCSLEQVSAARHHRTCRGMTRKSNGCQSSSKQPGCSRTGTSSQSALRHASHIWSVPRRSLLVGKTGRASLLSRSTASRRLPSLAHNRSARQSMASCSRGTGKRSTDGSRTPVACQSSHRRVCGGAHRIAIPASQRSPEPTSPHLF